MISIFANNLLSTFKVTNNENTLNGTYHSTTRRSTDHQIRHSATVSIVGQPKVVKLLTDSIQMHSTLSTT